ASSCPCFALFPAPSRIAGMADQFVISHIRRLPLFSQLTPEQLEAVGGAFQQMRYLPNDRPYRQGDTSQALYVFVSGGGRILYRGPDGIERDQGSVQAGGYVGEESLFVNQP